MGIQKIYNPTFMLNQKFPMLQPKVRWISSLLNLAEHLQGVNFEGREFFVFCFKWPPEKSILKTFESVWKWHESKANLNKFVGLHSTSPSNLLAQPDLLSTLSSVYRLFKRPFETMKDIQFH